jgi:hypothetical protein
MHLKKNCFQRNIKTQVIPTRTINQEVTVTTDRVIFELRNLQLTATARCLEAVPPIVIKTATGKILLLLSQGLHKSNPYIFRFFFNFALFRLQRFKYYTKAIYIKKIGDSI